MSIVCSIDHPGVVRKSIVKSKYLSVLTNFIWEKLDIQIFKHLDTVFLRQIRIFGYSDGQIFDTSNKDLSVRVAKYFCLSF